MVTQFTFLAPERVLMKVRWILGVALP